MSGSGPDRPQCGGPTATGPTSAGGGAHNEGDPMDVLGDEATWGTIDVLVGSTGAGAETIGPTAGNTTQDPPVAMEYMVPKASPVMEVGLGHPGRAQQHSRRSPLRIDVG